MLILSRKTETGSSATTKIRVWLHFHMNERELRASIAAVGPLLPVLVYRGRVVDGAKRDRICGELGLFARTQILHSVGEVCSALWALHPERAIAEARAQIEGATTAVIADLCSTRVAEVALILSRDRQPIAVDGRAPRRARSQKTELIRFWADPQFRHAVKRAGELEKLNLSETLRVAAWEYVQRTLANAATEGSERGPAVELVRPRKRRA